MMKTNPILSVMVLLAALSLRATAAEEAEQKVSLEKIPPAAAKAIKELSAGARITNLSKEKDEGKVVFEAQFTAKGHVHEITVDERGKLVSDEKVIALSEAPATVRRAIEREAAGGKLQKLERIEEGGTVFFEALVAANGKRTEVKFDSAGKELSRENKAANEKD
jgi:uncharacterized membrane protein YkoI